MENRRKQRIFTLGHADRSFAEFVEILERSAIKVVADVRSNPTSVRFPWFERAAMVAELERLGFSYRWFRELGGKRRMTPGEEQHTALDEASARYVAGLNLPMGRTDAQKLAELAASTNVVVLCAERSYEDCHRRYLSDLLETMDVKVVHIAGLDEAVDHTVHPDLAVENGRLLYRRRQLELIR